MRFNSEVYQNTPEQVYCTFKHKSKLTRLIEKIIRDNFINSRFNIPMKPFPKFQKSTGCRHHFFKIVEGQKSKKRYFEEEVFYKKINKTRFS